MGRKELTAAAKELNEVMELEGKNKIKTVAVKTAAMEADIKDAANDLDAEKDTLTAETLEVLDGLGVDVSGFESDDGEQESQEDIKEQDDADSEETEKEDASEDEVEIGADLDKKDQKQGIKVAEDLVTTLDYPKDLLKKMKKMSFTDLLAEIANIAGMINQPYEDEETGGTVQPDDKKSDFKKTTVAWLEKAGIDVDWGTEKGAKGKKEDKGSSKKDTKSNSKSKKSGGKKGPSNEQLMYDLIKAGKSDKEIAKQFAARYEGKDDDFVEKRIKIYKKIAEKKISEK